MFRDLSDRLNLSRDEGEKWIVNLIRETRMGADAKIDLEKVRRVICVPRGLVSIVRRHTHAQTLANYAQLGVFVLVWVWRHLGWVGGGGVQPPWIYIQWLDSHVRFSCLQPQTQTDICASVSAHCLIVSGHPLVGLWFDWAMR